VNFLCTQPLIVFCFCFCFLFLLFFWGGEGVGGYIIGYKVIVVYKCMFIEKFRYTQLIFLFIIILLLWGCGGEGMKHFIKYLLYVNIQGVFNTLYSVTYLFQYMTRDAIVRCFDAALMPCFFIITDYFIIWLMLCKVSGVYLLLLIFFFFLFFFG
jgi:hypothetical protein